MRRNHALRLLVALALVACGGRLESLPNVWPGAWPDTERGARTDATVDILTFNIKFDDPSDDEHPWKARRPIVLDLIRDEQPDIVGLQEALRSQLDDLLTLDAYRQLGVGRDDGKSGGEHAAILYRRERFAADDTGTFWLSPTPDVPGSVGWGNTLPRVCTWAHLTDRTSGRSLYVFNTHLDNRSQESRELGMELIAARIAARARPDPVVVMGDFNATEETRAVQYVLGHATRASDGTAAVAPSPRLVDALRVAHPGTEVIGTFHRWSGRTTGRRVDFIFTSPSPEAHVVDAAVLRARRDGRYPSDHFPVRARVALDR